MKIAIAGYGIEGKASFRYWNTPQYELTIADERDAVDDLPEGVATILGEGAFGKLDGFDLVIRTASLNPAKIMTNGKIWSATNEFFEKCPAPIIGVTGTKGKGTTASLITSILQAAGKTVHLVGNIGVSSLEILPIVRPEDIVVYELSSFQLWDITKSPSIAVVLIIEPDHLDVHMDFEDYVAAKANIRRYQGPRDVCIYHPTNEWAKQIATANQGDSLPPVRYGIADDEQAYVKENTFFIQSTPICSVETLQLPGVHNQENACAAISAAYHFTTDAAHIEKGLANFKGLPHRLEYVTSVNGVKYYDDSFSSATPATKVAVDSFSEPVILIAGGYDRGLDYTEFTSELAKRPNLKHVILLGQTASTLAARLRESGYHSVSEVDSLSEAVDTASQTAREGDVVIMSPGTASFDMFKNFSERGDTFKEIVRSL